MGIAKLVKSPIILNTKQDYLKVINITEAPNLNSVLHQTS